MAAQRFRGPVLPDGEARDLYVVDGPAGGVVTYEPQAGAEMVAEGWIVPGLVDAHCHVGLDEHGAVDDETSEQQAITDRDSGALLLRDCGSAADTSWIHDREDLPRLVRAGRHIARTKRYIRNYAHEVEPAELPAYVAQEAQRGDGWVKLVGDWIDRDTGDLAPSFPADAFAEAIRVAHEHGAKVTAHCFGEAVLPGLIGAGIDCIEHGTGLSEDLIDEMVARGTALVPTAMQLNNFPEYASAAGEKFPAYAEHMHDLHRRRRDTIMAAYEAGVAIYAGTDAGGVLPHGLIASEVRELADYGFSAEAALGAASWRAREWLGLDGRLSEGTTADFVVFDRDPLQDLSVLAEPSCIVLRGRVVG
ncbi:amidohydrolase family protein [Marmoricola sp. URHB0036]|uniref:amidohydrolase family protein n=1 Tax=Marmoricola sp. URHB0036 TaxID=1298863 RepID=UPI0004880F94|nr:amidohydrolase family protein [Marmoricola sp. URHB0036]